MKKLDVVFTWVDPTQPEWRREKATASGKKSYANNEARYNSNLEELKFALRSLEAYFTTDINHVFLLTNHGSVPSFIDLQHPQVTVINDRELLSGISFCSCTFESVLHLIPGLSENFIYFNDDMMLNAPLNWDDLFDQENRPIWYQESHKLFRFFAKLPFLFNFIDVDGDVTLARHHTYKQLNIGPKMPAPIGHNGRVLNKTMMADFIDQYPKEIATLRKAKFRSKTVFCFLDAYCYFWESKGCLRFEKGKKTLLLYQGMWFSRLVNRVAMIGMKKASFLCVIDVRRRTTQCCAFLSKLFERRFPKRSRWENL